MTREFLKTLGLEEAAVDRILDENMADIGREKARGTQAKTDLAEAREALTAVQGELESLKKSNGDLAAVQQRLTDLQAKYDQDTAALTARLAERDYAEAVTRAIGERGLKFSSKSAERAFTAALKEQKLPLKDGALEGLEGFLQAQREADPDAFAPERPAPRLLGPLGGGGAPPEPVPANVAQAREMGAARAAGRKASGDVLKHYL